MQQRGWTVVSPIPSIDGCGEEHDPDEDAQEDEPQGEDDDGPGARPSNRVRLDNAVPQRPGRQGDKNDTPQ